MEHRSVPYLNTWEIEHITLSTLGQVKATLVCRWNASVLQSIPNVSNVSLSIQPKSFRSNIFVFAFCFPTYIFTDYATIVWAVQILGGIIT